MERAADPVPVRPDLRGLEGYHSAQVDAPVRLNTNESPFPPPPDWLDEYQRAVARIDWNRYPDRRAGDLRTAIAQWYGVASERIFAANGSNEVIQTLLLAYAGPGRRVAVFEPSYQLHRHIARITGATVVAGERRADFKLDAGEAGEFVARADPDVTFLCSPNNPTGIVESPAVLAAVLEASRGLVIVDEAYAEFSSWSALDQVEDQGRVVVVRTFSKTWSMAAARLGFAVAPAWVVGELDKVVLPYHLDAAKQLAGVLALRHTGDMERRVATVVEQRARVVDALGELADTGVPGSGRCPSIEVFPSGANFVLMRFHHHDAHAVWQRLVDGGVLVRDCSGWSRLAGCLRVTIGSADENDRFLDALAASLTVPDTATSAAVTSGAGTSGAGR